MPVLLGEITSTAIVGRLPLAHEQPPAASILPCRAYRGYGPPAPGCAARFCGVPGSAPAPNAALMAKEHSPDSVGLGLGRCGPIGGELHVPFARHLSGALQWHCGRSATMHTRKTNQAARGLDLVSGGTQAMPLMVIFGPTSSGKTALSLQIAAAAP